MIPLQGFSQFDFAIGGKPADALLSPNTSFFVDPRFPISPVVPILSDPFNRPTLDDLIRDNNDLCQFVDDFFDSTKLNLRDLDERRKLSNLIEKIEAGNADLDSIPLAFRGLGGLQTTLFLKSLLFLEKKCKIFGKIKDYVFCDESEKGYDCTDEKHVGVGSGHLAVEVVVETFDTDSEFIKDNPSRSEFNHWDIEIKREIDQGLEGYKVIERTGSASEPNDNPFPGTVLFPEANTNAANSRSVWCRGLDHKLYAEGRSIQVRHIYQQIDCGPLTLLPPTDCRYEVTADSCIDLMFKGYPPAYKLPEQDSYCLGRCTSPQIVNSDGT